MFFLLRAIAIVAAIYHFSPVHQAGAPEPRADATTADRPAFDGAGRLAADLAELESRVLAALDDPRYENWSAVPQYARDRLAIEIARQLADAALAPPAPREP